MTLVDVPQNVREAALTLKEFIAEIQGQFDPELRNVELNDQYDVVNRFIQRQIDVEAVE